MRDRLFPGKRRDARFRTEVRLMRHITRLTALVVVGLFVLPLFAADEKKPDDKKDVDKKGPELVKAGVLTGKVLSIDETKRTVKLRLELPELNQNTVNAMARDQAEIQ